MRCTATLAALTLRNRNLLELLLAICTRSGHMHVCHRKDYICFHSLPCNVMIGVAVQAEVGQVDAAKESIASYTAAFRSYGWLPEQFVDSMDYVRPHRAPMRLHRA